MKTVAINAKQIAEQLGLSDHDASMSVIHQEVDEDAYRTHLKERTGSRPVDLVTANLQMPSMYQGMAVGSNALIRVTFMNGLYVNEKDGEPSWINFTNVKKLLEAEGVTVKANRRLCYNKQPLMRVLTGDDTLMAAKDAPKKGKAFWSRLPGSVRTHIENGVKLHVIPFFYSASPRPRAGKGTGWWETKIDLYRLSDMLDDPKLSPDRHFGPQYNPRQRGMLNGVQYGLIGSSVMDTESDEATVTTSYTHLFYIQWLGYFENGQWIDRGSRIIVMEVATANRARVTYFKARAQPAVYETLCGGNHILPRDLLVQTQPVVETDSAPAQDSTDDKKGKSKKVKRTESGTGGGNGNGTTLGDLLKSKGQSLPSKSEPPAVTEEPAS